MPASRVSCCRRPTSRRTVNRRRTRGRAPSRSSAPPGSRRRGSRTCWATSPKRIIPEAPIGLDDSTPPDGFHGMSPSGAVAPFFGELPALAFRAEPEVLEPHRLVPRERHVDLGAVEVVPWVRDARLPSRRRPHTRGPPAGSPGRGPANIVGSLRIAVPWIHATGPGAASATCSLPITIAIAPSELGQTSR